MTGISWIRLTITSVDILVVAFLIYRALLVIRGTRALPMMWGSTVLVALYFVSKQFGLVTLDWILGNLLSSLIVVIVVIFQEEIRRGLTKVGLEFFRQSGKNIYDKVVEDVTLVCSTLSENKLGGLIVSQRDVGLDEFVEDAVPIDALVQRKLLYAMFVKPSPLHDGAVIIEGDRIKAAGCVLPLSFNPNIDPVLGTRHRAALGISERSDAIVVVVSEENGAISLVCDGKMTRNLDAAALSESLARLLSIAPEKRLETNEAELQQSRA
jgi:diadenylate cyclase